MRSVSLSRFLIDEQWRQHAIPSDLRLLVEVDRVTRHHQAR